MDQEKEMVKREEVQPVMEWADVGEGNVSSLCTETETNKDREIPETVTPDTPGLVEANNGDLPEVMKNLNVSDNSQNGDTSASKNESPIENIGSSNNLKCHIAQDEVEGELKLQASQGQCYEDDVQNESSPNLTSENCNDSAKFSEYASGSSEDVYQECDEKCEESIGETKEMSITDASFHSISEDDVIVKVSTDNENSSLKTGKMVAEEKDWNDGIQEELSSALTDDEKELHIGSLQIKSDLLAQDVVEEASTDNCMDDNQHKSSTEAQEQEIIKSKTFADSDKTLNWVDEETEQAKEIAHSIDEQSIIKIEVAEILENNCNCIIPFPEELKEDQEIASISLDAVNDNNIQVTSDSHENGDSVLTNESEEGSVTTVQGMEVLDLKTNDDISELPEKEKTAEGSQRPRTRTYPFKVLVSGLPLGARREDVTYYFSQFGEVLKLWDEGRHRANVLFADEESFKKAIFAPDPYFDDHKLKIRSINETTTIISGIPRNIPAKDAEKAVKTMLEEAGVTPCRISVPLSDLSETTKNVIQGHAFVGFIDLQTLQKAEEIQINKPLMISDSPVKLYSSCNEFYEKFCLRVFPIQADQRRAVVNHSIHTALSPLGEIVAILCQYVGNATAYAGYVLFDSEDSVKQAKEMREVKILEEFTEIQDFFPFEQGHGFSYLWLKVLNLPQRVTITEIKHHFGHDRGILNIELDLDFGSCFMHVNSEATIQRCLQMHQTYLRGKCIAVLIAEDHPDRTYYRDISRRGYRRPNFRNSGRKKSGSNNSTGFNGKTFTSATQPQGSQGNQDRRGFERGDRKFSKSRSNANHPKEVPKVVKEDGDGVKIADSPAM